MSVEAVAKECGLSRSHFIQAFRRSTGVPPYQWLLRQRLERAKLLMRTTSMPLVDIAAACGFSDQSHLTRHFSRAEGIGPAAWRILER